VSPASLTPPVVEPPADVDPPPVVDPPPDVPVEPPLIDPPLEAPPEALIDEPELAELGSDEHASIPTRETTAKVIRCMLGH
jgi:hypothetical protein